MRQASGPAAGGASRTAGRASRTALLSIVAALLGAGLFDDVRDPWLTAAPFVLVVVATSALTSELAGQARRGHGDPGNRWTLTDTANLLILLSLATLLAASFAFAGTPQHERVSAVCFAALYLLLATWFWHSRRHNLH